MRSRVNEKNSKSRVKEYIDSSILRNDGTALLEEFTKTGYLLVRSVIDKSVCLEIEHIMLEATTKANWTEVGSRTANMANACREPEPSYRAVMDNLWNIPALHRIPRSVGVSKLIQYLLPENEIYFHPRIVLRATFPSKPTEDYFSKAHQDFPEVQGTEKTLTIWFSFHDCPRSNGSLAIAPRTHTEGLLPIDIADTASGIVVKDTPQEWHVGDLFAGDVLIFNPFTVHVSYPNTSSMLKFSTDFRVQPVNEPICETCLMLPDQNFGWDSVSDEIKENLAKPVQTVPFNPAFEIERDRIAINAAAAATTLTPAVARCLTYAAHFSRNLLYRGKAREELLRLGCPDGIQLGF